MWTNINNPDIIKSVRPGNILSQDPDDFESFHTIETVHADYLKAVHNRSGKAFAIYLQHMIMSGTWWVRSEEHTVLSV